MTVDTSASFEAGLYQNLFMFFLKNNERKVSNHKAQRNARGYHFSHELKKIV